MTLKAKEKSKTRNIHELVVQYCVIHTKQHQIKISSRVIKKYTHHVICMYISTVLTMLRKVLKGDLKKEKRPQK